VSHDDSFEKIPDTDEEKTRRRNPATVDVTTVSPSVGGGSGDLPPLRMDDMMTTIRATSPENHGVAAQHPFRRFRSTHDFRTLVAVLSAMAAARADLAAKLYEQTVQLVGSGDDASNVLSELLRLLDQLLQHASSSC